MFIERSLFPRLQQFLQAFPAVAILGPRQCGKSTLSKHLLKLEQPSLYLDLEKRADRQKLQEPELFFQENAEALICLDEVQRMPELFTVLRSVIDEQERNGQFLILGSASKELLRQSSESLAGRIVYLELTPLLLPELLFSLKSTPSLQEKLWIRGGMPRSFLAEAEELSWAWRESYIQSFIERDLPQLGVNIAAETLERFWRMCAHLHGQILNRSKLGESLGVSYHTIQNYLELFEKTFLMRILPAHSANIKKRLIKSPRIYIRDSGLLHSLLDIENMNQLLGHPQLGSSWEGLVIEHILTAFPKYSGSFYRTEKGDEIDLILERGTHKIAIECKASTAPSLKKGFYRALEDLNIDEAWVIAPVSESYPIAPNIRVAPLEEFLGKERS